MPLVIDDRRVLLAVRSKVLSLPDIPPQDRRAWENREFKPPNPEQNVEDAAWLRETYLPADESPAGSAITRAVGIVQYDIVVPSNRGTAYARDLAYAIKQAFSPPGSINHSLDGVVTTVMIDAVRPLAAIYDGPWYLQPVLIYWRTYAIEGA